jgi:hypothetical protein
MCTHKYCCKARRSRQYHDKLSNIGVLGSGRRREHALVAHGEPPGRRGPGRRRVARGAGAFLTFPVHSLHNAPKYLSSALAQLLLMVRRYTLAVHWFNWNTRRRCGGLSSGPFRWLFLRLLIIIIIIIIRVIIIVMIIIIVIIHLLIFMYY